MLVAMVFIIACFLSADPKSNIRGATKTKIQNADVRTAIFGGGYGSRYWNVVLSDRPSRLPLLHLVRFYGLPSNFLSATRTCKERRIISCEIKQMQGGKKRSIEALVRHGGVDNLEFTTQVYLVQRVAYRGRTRTEETQPQLRRNPGAVRSEFFRYVNS